MMIIKNDFDKVIAKTTMLMLIPSWSKHCEREFIR